MTPLGEPEWYIVCAVIVLCVVLRVWASVAMQNTDSR